MKSATSKAERQSAKSEGSGDKKQSTRDQLLDATGALMIENNTTSVSFGEISVKSGINAALIRYHFGSKQGLLEALLERDAGDNYAALEKLVNADWDPVEKMRLHIHGVIRLYQRVPYLNRLLISLQSDSESEISRYVMDRFTTPVVNAEKAILEQGHREGVFRDVDPLLFHFSLIGACDSIFHSRSALLQLVGVETIDDKLRDRYADHVSKMILGGLLVREAGND
ncbi:TetR family transcriptional regulator [Novosphingobium sp. ZN18A2]|uniref:TetR family transcriptional regulator n=1 Tax=Novosphingobium sp. ZN18A2 TaxID=3079861 RepID=UPI0030D5A649